MPRMPGTHSHAKPEKIPKIAICRWMCVLIHSTPSNPIEEGHYRNPFKPRADCSNRCNAIKHFRDQIKLPRSLKKLNEETLLKKLSLQLIFIKKML